jgi:hypothetical protein
MAMMCSARLMRRLPARESRWRFCSPEEASMGAVPFQEAKWARLVNRPMSPSSRVRTADAVQVQQPATGAGDQLSEFLLGDFDLLVDHDEFVDQLGEHRLVAVAVGAEPALAEGLLTVVDDLDGGRPLVRVHADDDSCHPRLDPTRAGGWDAAPRSSISL